MEDEISLSFLPSSCSFDVFILLHEDFLVDLSHFFYFTDLNLVISPHILSILAFYSVDSGKRQ